jgi:hypothetical protein
MSEIERLAREWFAARREFLTQAEFEKVADIRPALDRLASAENDLFIHLLKTIEE